jgi:glutathionyl-hydroquinone reductase
MHLKETALQGVDWIHLAQHMRKWHAVVHTALNFGLYNVGIALTNRETGSCSTGIFFNWQLFNRNLLHGNSYAG